MLKVKAFVCNMFREICYVASDETGECIIIDCGANTSQEQAEVIDYIRNNNLTPKHLVATHGHIDHHLGDEAMQEAFALRSEVHSDDRELMENMEMQSVSLTGVVLETAIPQPGSYFTEGTQITFGHHTIVPIHTPGHTPGSVCLYCEQEGVLFTGDTLFNGSIGRTDLWGGSMFAMIQSLRKLSQLPDNTTVYPGHGPQTTIGHEVAHNPYLDR